MKTSIWRHKLVIAFRNEKIIANILVLTRLSSKRCCYCSLATMSHIVCAFVRIPRLCCAVCISFICRFPAEIKLIEVLLRDVSPSNLRMCWKHGHWKNDHRRPPQKTARQKWMALLPNKVYWCSQSEDDSEEGFYVGNIVSARVSRHVL